MDLCYTGLMILITADNKGLIQQAQDLTSYHRNALPYAIAATLDTAAEMAREGALKDLPELFILRNTYTRRRINYQKTINRKNIDTMQSEMGSPLEYLQQQEAGFTHDKAWVPTGAASGQQKTKRTKPILKSNYRAKLKIQPEVQGVRSAKSKLLVAVTRAVDTNRRILFLGAWAGVRSGVYRVIGGEAGGEETAAGWPRGAVLRMFYDRAKKQTKTPAHAWMAPAAKAANDDKSRIFEYNIQKQLKMRKLFRDNKK